MSIHTITNLGMDANTVLEDTLTSNGAEAELQQTLPRRLLVLGSSVSTGSGATQRDFGWVALLQAAIRTHGFEVWNRGKSGSFVKYWQKEDNLHAEDVTAFAVVLMSLSLGNEGLASLKTSEQIDDLEKQYIFGLHAIALSLREKMHPRARLVLCGPYPNNDYECAHLQALRRVFLAMQRWSEADYIVDFLQPVVHDGHGHWHEGAAQDAGHPNDLGHKQMFACLDPQGILGRFMEPTDLCPVMEAGLHVPGLKVDQEPLRFKYVGKRSGTFKDAAVGWFEVIGDYELIWRSFNGIATNPETWVARKVFRGLTLQGKRIAWTANGFAAATLEYGTFGKVAAVSWGTFRWERDYACFDSQLALNHTTSDKCV